MFYYNNIITTNSYNMFTHNSLMSFIKNCHYINVIFKKIILLFNYWENNCLFFI